jgi:hypothetical protein
MEWKRSSRSESRTVPRLPLDVFPTADALGKGGFAVQTSLIPKLFVTTALHMYVKCVLMDGSCELDRI